MHLLRTPSTPGSWHPPGDVLGGELVHINQGPLCPRLVALCMIDMWINVECMVARHVVGALASVPEGVFMQLLLCKGIQRMD